MSKFSLTYIGIFFLIISILSFFNILYSYYFNLYLNVLFLWFMTQNILVETIMYLNQVGGVSLLSWAPLMPLVPWLNPTIFSFGEREVTLQSQSAWLIATPIFYKIAIYYHKKTGGK